MYQPSRLEMGVYSFPIAGWRDFYDPYHIVIRDMRDMPYEINEDSSYLSCIGCRIFAWVCYLESVSINVLNEWSLQLESQLQGTLCRGYSSAWGGMSCTACSFLHQTHTYRVEL